MATTGMTHDEKQQRLARLAAEYAAAVCDLAEDGGDSRMAEGAEEACDWAAAAAQTERARQAWLHASACWQAAARAWDEEEDAETEAADDERMEACENASAEAADVAARATALACQASGIEPVPPTIG